MQSSLSFVSTVQDFIGQHPEAPLKDIRLFWNRMDSRTSKELYVMYNAIVLRMGLKVFETVLPDLERFNKEMTPSSRQHFRCICPGDGTYHISGIRTMAKKREIFKVDEDALKDMMASESISCGKSGTDVGENVLPVTEKEKNVPDVKTQGQEKSRKTIRADPGLEEKVEMYKELFLDRKKSVHRKQTYISYDMYCRLARILPLLSDDMSVPAFLDNVLAHHLETYSEELGELFRRKTPKTF